MASQNPFSIVGLYVAVSSTWKLIYVTYIDISQLCTFSINVQTVPGKTNHHQTQSITFKCQTAVPEKSRKQLLIGQLCYASLALVLSWMLPWIWSAFHHWHAEHSPGFQTADILELRTQPAAWTGSPRGQHTDLHANTQSGQFAVLDWEEHPSLQNMANTEST